MSCKKLGEYIQQVNERNRDLETTVLLGVSITKKLIPSIANTIGTDMSVYKIIKRRQFAYGTVTSRNGEKISIALADEYEKALVSQIYVVFEVVDTTILLPEYLMMWFSRPEFDRYARYHSHGSTRETFDWADLCETELPIPSIEEQSELVKQYHTISDKIKVNEQICEKLETTAQTLYKHWFVDFEFPNEEGKPYKSSGGKMVFNEELAKEIPEGWEVGTLGDISEMIDGDRGINYPNFQDFYNNEYCLFLNAGNVTKKGFDFSKCSFIKKEKDQLLRKGKLQVNDIVLTSRGTVGNLAFYTDITPFTNVRINSGMLIIRPRLQASYLYSFINSFEFSKSIENYVSCSAVPQLPIKDLNAILILVPAELLMNKFSTKILPIYKEKDIIKNLMQKLNQLQSLLLSRLAVGKEMSA